MQKPNHATLTIGDKTYSLPMKHGSMGPSVIDVSKLYQTTGCFTYDPGFSSTASCQSAITYIDGDTSTLLYRGYAVDELALNRDFSDVTYLLLYGDLPDKKQKKKFVALIKNHTMLHEQVHRFFSGFRRDAHPMAIMVAVTGALSAFYHDELDISDSSQRELVCVRLIAKMPTLAAMAYKYSIGQPFVYPENELGFVENFLQMCFAVPAEKYQVKPWIADALGKIFVLHADHEQNASTSTVRLAASSGANPYACVAAGIASLWGPSHGGANEAALNMLEQIGSRGNIEYFVKRAKDPNDSFRLMGFGHRVYKSYDPRAKVLQKTCHEVLQNTGSNDPILEVAKQLEDIVLNDPYFVERKLYPNVDFYSGIILRAIGFPVSLFTVLFAVSRTVGWLAQWKELMGDDKQKIGRPRQLFVGQKKRILDNK